MWTLRILAKIGQPFQNHTTSVKELTPIVVVSAIWSVDFRDKILLVILDNSPVAAAITVLILGQYNIYT